MTSSTVLRRHGLVAALAVLAVPAAACGGGGGSSDESKSTKEWADGVCSAVNTWTDSLRTAAQSLSGGNFSKETLQSAASDVQDATTTFKDDLESLGAPDTESGDKAKESIDQLSDNIQQGVDTIENAVKDVSGANGALIALSTVTGTISTMSTQVRTTIEDLQRLDPDSELDKAFEDASSCSKLRSEQG
jgi:hypothetical protein